MSHRMLNHMSDRIEKSQTLQRSKTLGAWIQASRNISWRSPKKWVLAKQRYLFVIRSYKYRTSPSLQQSDAEAPESASILPITEKTEIQNQYKKKYKMRKSEIRN